MPEKKEELLGIGGQTTETPSSDSYNTRQYKETLARIHAIGDLIDGEIYEPIPMTGQVEQSSVQTESKVISSSLTMKDSQFGNILRFERENKKKLRKAA